MFRVSAPRATERPSAAESASPTSRASGSRWEALALALIALVAVFLRLDDLADVPRGLLFDEAYNAVDALQILGGWRPIFLPGNFGREPLFIYAQALGIALLGRTDLAMRLPAALFSLATMVVAYALVRRLFGARVALLTSAWHAVSFWDLALSRVGLRTISLPFFLCASFYCLWRGIDGFSVPGSGSWRGTEIPPTRALLPDARREEDRREDASPRNQNSAPSTRSMWWFALGGLFLGGSLYTYTTARFAPFVLLVFAGYLALVDWRLLRASFGGFVVTGLVTTLVFLPEGRYFLHYPDVFFHRAQAVSSVLNPSGQAATPAALVDALARNLGIFSFAGDVDWSRNLPGRPLLDPITSLLGAIGLILAIRRARRPAVGFALIWLVVMLLPSLLTTIQIPNNLRVTGIIPLPFLLPSLATEVIWERWEKRFLRFRTLPWLLIAVATLAGALATYRTYFVAWATAPQVSDVFNADRWTAIQAAQQVATSEGGTVFVAAGDADQPLQQYLLEGDADGARLRLFDGTRSAILPPQPDATTYVFAQRDASALTLFRRFFPGLVAAPGPLDPDGRPSLIVRIPPAAPRLDPERPLPARFGGDLRVLGFDLDRDVSAGGTLRVRWYWQLIGPVPRELSFFNQILDEREQRVGQVDAPAFAPSYWPTGTRGVSTFDVPIAPGLSSGVYTLVVGVYDPRTLERLPVLDGNGDVAGGQLTLGPIKVHGQPATPPTVVIPAPAAFDDGIDLLGYDVQPRDARSGASVTLTLDWSARARPSSDYTVFVHLLDPRGKIVAQADAPPRAGRDPTSLWDAGDMVADSHLLQIPADATPGAYRLEIGLYRPGDGKRLALVEGRSDAVDLGGLSIR